MVKRIINKYEKKMLSFINWSTLSKATNEEMAQQRDKKYSFEEEHSLILLLWSVSYWNNIREDLESKLNLVIKEIWSFT